MSNQPADKCKLTLKVRRGWFELYPSGAVYFCRYFQGVKRLSGIRAIVATSKLLSCGKWV